MTLHRKPYALRRYDAEVLQNALDKTDQLPSIGQTLLEGWTSGA